MAFSKGTDPDYQLLKILLAAPVLPADLCKFIASNVVDSGITRHLLRPEGAPYVDIAAAQYEERFGQPSRLGSTARLLNRVRAGAPAEQVIADEFTGEGFSAVDTFDGVALVQLSKILPDDRGINDVLSAFAASPVSDLRALLGTWANHGGSVRWAYRAAASLSDMVHLSPRTAVAARLVIRDALMCHKHDLGPQERDSPTGEVLNIDKYLALLRAPELLVAALNVLRNRGQVVKVRPDLFGDNVVNKVAVPLLNGDLAGRLTLSQVKTLMEEVNALWTAEHCVKVAAAARSAQASTVASRRKMGTWFANLVATRASASEAAVVAGKAVGALTLADLALKPTADVGQWMLDQLPVSSAADWSAVFHIAAAVDPAMTVQDITTVIASTLT